MATPLPPSAPRPRRLTLRELQERNRQADMAFAACKVLLERWDEEHSDDLRSGNVDAMQLLVEHDGQMQEHLAVMRAALPSGRERVKERSGTQVSREFECLCSCGDRITPLPHNTAGHGPLPMEPLLHADQQPPPIRADVTGGN